MNTEPLELDFSWSAARGAGHRVPNLDRFPSLPVARTDDPESSHQAATRAALGASAQEEAILAAASHDEPRTAFQIARTVEATHPDRWAEGGIRTCLSRLGKAGLLVKADQKGEHRGHPVDMWQLP